MNKNTRDLLTLAHEYTFRYKDTTKTAKILVELYPVQTKLARDIGIGYQTLQRMLNGDPRTDLRPKPRYDVRQPTRDKLLAFIEKELKELDYIQESKEAMLADQKKKLKAFNKQDRTMEFYEAQIVDAMEDTTSYVENSPVTAWSLFGILAGAFVAVVSVLVIFVGALLVLASIWQSQVFNFGAGMLVVGCITGTLSVAGVSLLVRE